MSGRSLKIALAASLAINVFIIGSFAGALYVRQAAPGARAPLNQPLFRAADGLPAPDRDAFRQMLRAQVPAVRPLNQDAREARRQASLLLLAPSFDRAAAGALMARARSDDQQVRAQIENAVLDFAAKLPADERISLIQGMRRAAAQRWTLGLGPARPQGGNSMPARP